MPFSRVRSQSYRSNSDHETLVQMFKPRRNEEHEEDQKRSAQKPSFVLARFFVVCTNLCCSDLERVLKADKPDLTPFQGLKKLSKLTLTDFVVEMTSSAPQGRGVYSYVGRYSPKPPAGATSER